MPSRIYTNSDTRPLIVYNNESAVWVDYDGPRGIFTVQMSTDEARYLAAVLIDHCNQSDRIRNLKGA